MLRGLETLRDADVPYSILSVIQLGADGLAAHRHLLSLEPAGINYLFPDFTHDSFDEVQRSYGPTPCWDFLRPILEDWSAAWPPTVMVPLFWNVIRLVMGAQGNLDVLGNARLPFAFVYPDGALEALDVLGVCGTGVPATGLDVRTSDVADIHSASDFHRTIMFEGTVLPDACRACPERDSCGGGYLPHRYSADRGFDTPPSGAPICWRCSPTSGSGWKCRQSRRRPAAKRCAGSHARWPRARLDAELVYGLRLGGA